MSYRDDEDREADFADDLAIERALDRGDLVECGGCASIVAAQSEELQTCVSCKGEFCDACADLHELGACEEGGDA